MDKHSTYDGTEKRWEDKTNVALNIITYIQYL